MGRLAVLSASSGFALLPFWGAAQEPSRFAIEAALVRIGVVVLGPDGKPVAGLHRDDFELLDEGRPCRLISFEPVVVQGREPGISGPSLRVSATTLTAAEENANLLVFFDDVHVQSMNTEQVQAHLLRFVERELRVGDWLTIVAPLEGIRFTARTAAERSNLPTVIRSLRGQLVRPRLDENPIGNPSDYAAMRAVEYGSPADFAAEMTRGRNSSYTGNRSLLAAETYAIAQRRIRQTMTGLAQAIASLNGLPGRKTLILYSEGFIRSPSMPDYDRVVELARRNQVSIYYVDPRGLGRETSPGEIDMVSGGAIYLATATGGTASISNDLAATLRDLLLQSSTYYLLGFEPSPGVPGERRLQVSVRRDRHQVLAPDRYLVSEAPPSREAGSPGTLSDAAQEAAGAIADSAGLPLRVAALFGELPTGETSTTIAIELPRATAGGRPRHLDMLIEARPAVAGVSVHDVATMSVPAGDGPVVAARQLGLHAGVWQSRIVVRDPLSGAVGSVLHTFEVPLAVGLRISSPILSDELVAGPAPRPRLRVDRRFGSGATLYCLFRVLGAAVDDEAGKQRVTVDAAVRSSGGVVRAEEHSKIEAAKGGQLLEILKIGLGGLPVDEYRLVLTVRDAVTGRTHTVEEPFSVVGAN